MRDVEQKNVMQKTIIRRTPMKQLVLDLGADQAHSLASFEVGQNAEAAALMAQFADRTSREHFAYLWGAGGVGKTHLLKALASAGGEAEQLRARYISPFSIESEFVYSPEVDLYLLDDCENCRRWRRSTPSPCSMKSAPIRLTWCAAARWRPPCCRCAKICVPAWAGA